MQEKDAEEFWEQTGRGFLNFQKKYQRKILPLSLRSPTLTSSQSSPCVCGGRGLALRGTATPILCILPDPAQFNSEKVLE